MSSIQLRSGPINFIQDLNGSTGTTAFPSGTSVGVSFTASVASSPGQYGDRIHVALRYQADSGVLSTDVHLYGYKTSLALWTWLGAMNNGASLTTTGATIADGNGFVIQKAEWFNASPEMYERFMTRCINPQGTNPLISTWIGCSSAS